MKYEKEIKTMIKESIVFDIETSAADDQGRPIDIRKEFDLYVEWAEVKWIGFYSFKYDKYYELKVKGNEELIKSFFDDHSNIIGFNSNNFDYPVCFNNGLIPDKFFNQIDVMEILGTNAFQGHKMRMNYMKVKSEGNSLKAIAEAFDLPAQKGDIDYNIFFQDVWNEEETVEIKKYLRADVEVTKLLFDKLVEFWADPFTDWLYYEDVLNWSWLKSSIASLTYKAACKIKGVKPTYGNPNEDKETMGGRAIEPPQEEEWDLEYLDEASKYPHTFAEFGLFNEVDVSDWEDADIAVALKKGDLWHGNELFRVKGYYWIDEQHPLGKDVIEKLKVRFNIKKILKSGETIPDDERKRLEALEYAIKIFLNALYGAVRSPIFEQIHSPNAGYDCCWIGQQIHECVEKYFNKQGYEARGGFTDSWFFKYTGPGETPSKKSIIEIADKCMCELQEHMPFPADTHIIGYECHMDYVMFHYDSKEKRYKKNNYCYITDGKVKIVGFPIKKSNASKLGKLVYKKYLEAEILTSNHAKFDSDWLIDLVDSEINIADMVVSYDCKPADAYKPRIDKKTGFEVPSSNIYAQVSRGYTDSLGGKVTLVKNRKAGKIGNAITRLGEGKPLGKAHWYYGTVEECEAAGVTIHDLDKTKIYNELAPFCKGGKL